MLEHVLNALDSPKILSIAFVVWAYVVLHFGIHVLREFREVRKMFAEGRQHDADRIAVQSSRIAHLEGFLQATLEYDPYRVQWDDEPVH